MLTDRPSLRPIHYLGNKARLLEVIAASLDLVDPDRGRVVDLRGRPVAGAAVVAIPQGALRDRAFSPSDPVADRIMLFGLGVVIAALAWRYASIIAIPSRGGLMVRNLVLTRTLEWPEIVGIQFGGGEPWVSLDLVDGDTLAVMAIQKADGEISGREASRLAALVQAFGEFREGSSS